MKLLVLTLLAIVGAIEVRNIKQEPLASASVDDILAEVKHRVEVCGESSSSLAGLSLDDLFAELKKREAAKVCEDPKAAAATEGAGEEVTAAAAATELTTAPTTTTTTTPCPKDNFMDEVVDQANPDFEMWDTDRDGCLTHKEMSTTLRRQIETARSRDYYWIRRNITNAAKGMIKDWHKDHATADENDSGCVNRDELKIIQDAVCDCGTQFMFMDHNADGKISQQEAATYVSEHMVHADLNFVKLQAIWKAADVNGDKFLNKDEFCEAGPRYKGDGKEGAPGPGPGPAPGPAPAAAL